MTLGLTLVNFKLLTSFLENERLAQYTLVITFQGFATLIITGPLRVGLVRLYASALQLGSGWAFSRYGILVLVSTGVCTIIFGLGVALLLDYKALNLTGVLLALSFGIATDYTNFSAGQSLQRGEKGCAVIFMLMTKIALTIGLVIAGVVYTAPTAVSVLLWALISWVIMLSVVQRVEFSRSWLTADVKENWPKWTSELGRFSWIFMVTGIISWGQTSLPRFFLLWWQDSQAIVQFYIFTQIAALSLQTVGTTITQVVSPRLFRRHDSGHPKAMSCLQPEILIGGAVALTVGAVVALASLNWGGRLVQSLTGVEYADASYLLAIVFIAYGVNSASRILRLYGDQQIKPRIYLLANIVYPTFAVALAFIGSRSGLQTLLLGILVGELFHLTLVLVTNQRYSAYLRKADKMNA